MKYWISMGAALAALGALVWAEPTRELSTGEAFGIKGGSLCGIHCKNIMYVRVGLSFREYSEVQGLMVYTPFNPDGLWNQQPGSVTYWIWTHGVSYCPDDWIAHATGVFGDMSDPKPTFNSKCVKPPS